MLYILLVILNIQVHASRFLWQPNTLFNEKKNWLPSNHTFKSCDIANIPEDVQGGILLEANIILKELILPLDGLLAFSEGSSITFDDGYDDRMNYNTDCIGQEVTYKGVYSDDLFDSTNYCVDGVEECPLSDRTEVDQIPTIADDLVFPIQGHFVVDLSHLETVFPLKSLEANNKVYKETHKLSNYMSGVQGHMQFLNSDYQNSTHFLIRNRPQICSKLGNCHHTEIIRRHVCSKIECPATNCDAELVTLRTCCPLCRAAALTITSLERPMNLELLRKILAADVDTKAVSVKVAYVNDIMTEIIFEDFINSKKSAYFEAERFSKRVQDGKIKQLNHYNGLKMNIKKSYDEQPREKLEYITVSWFSKFSYIVSGLIIILVIFSIYIIRNSQQILDGKIPIISKFLFKLAPSKDVVEENHFENPIYDKNIQAEILEKSDEDEEEYCSNESSLIVEIDVPLEKKLIIAADINA